MKWTRLKITLIACVLTVPVLLTGCNFGKSSSGQIDPPPAEVESQMLANSDNSPTTAPPAEEAVSTVFLKNDQGLLAPVSLHLPAGTDEDKMIRALGMLVQNGAYRGLIPHGFTGVLPEGTEVKAVTVKADEKLAIVEFTKPFSQYDAKDERKIMEAVTWTLTEFPDVKFVQLWVDGNKLNEMPVNGTPLDRDLSRAVGINLEIGNSTTLSGTSPVTVYFSSQTEDGTSYFVPVTRFVPAGGDQVQAALQELIKGPAREGGLQRVMSDATQIEGITNSKDGIVTVSIKDDMFEAGEKLPAEMMQSVVLTVSDNSKGEKVRIWLNGEKEVIGTDNQKYSEAVSKPVNINKIPM